MRSRWYMCERTPDGYRYWLKSQPEQRFTLSELLAFESAQTIRIKFLALKA